MANLSIRKLDDEVVRRLRRRAGAHGVSMEEEARQILAEAVASPERLGDFALSVFGPIYGCDLELPEHAAHDPVDLGGS